MEKAVILAAGKGTRMKSDLPKVMHPVGGRPMIQELLGSLRKAGVTDSVVVISPEMKRMQEVVAPARLAIQKQQLGTANAVLSAREVMGDFEGCLLILFGDTPLIRSATIQKMLDVMEQGADAVVLAFEPNDPAHYGRLVMGAKGLQQIVEFKDATPQQREIRLCNSGMMCVRAPLVWQMLEKVENNNAAKEYYLPDIITLLYKSGHRIEVVMGDKDEVMGVNSRAELSRAEFVFQQRRRFEVMASGVTLIDPLTTYFSYDTVIGPDAVIEPCVFFDRKVFVEDGAHVPAFSHLFNERVKKER